MSVRIQKLNSRATQTKKQDRQSLPKPFLFARLCQPFYRYYCGIACSAWKAIIHATHFVVNYLRARFHCQLFNLASYKLLIVSKALSKFVFSQQLYCLRVLYFSCANSTNRSTTPTTSNCAAWCFRSCCANLARPRPARAWPGMDYSCPEQARSEYCCSRFSYILRQPAR